MEGETRLGGAYWCAQHKRWECVKKSKRSQERCHAIALSNTDRCRSHSGLRPEVQRARGVALSAFSAIAAAGVTSNSEMVDPATATLGMLHMSWLRVHLYAGLLEAQVAAEGGGAGDVPNDPGDVVRGAGDSPDTGGLVGHTYGAVKDIGIYVSGEAPRGLALLEAQERERCVKFAKTAHDMGIADRQIQLAESQGALLAGVIRAVLGDLDLTPEQQARVPEVVPRHLRAVAELEQQAGGAA